jgi:hypothetical protein
MENYTNPEQSGQEQNPQDLLNASLIFARALGLILNEGEGIVIDINGDVNLGDDVNKVIVFKKDEQVHIFKFEEDLPEGTAVSLNPPTEEQTEEVK